MRVLIEAPWPGHRIIVIIIKRWLKPYRWFNAMFARATWPYEAMIIDEAWYNEIKPVLTFPLKWRKQ